MEAIRLGVFPALSRQGFQLWKRDVRDRYSLERPVEQYKAEHTMCFCGLTFATRGSNSRVTSFPSSGSAFAIHSAEKLEFKEHPDHRGTTPELMGAEDATVSNKLSLGTLDPLTLRVSQLLRRA